MKKVIAVILAAICTLGLVSCNSTWSEQEEKSWSLGETYSDVDGIFVEISDIDLSPDKTSLTVSWNNTTDHMVIYGDIYRIQRLKNGEWVDCSIGEICFNTIGYLLMANEVADKEYILTGMYDISKPGTYRFITDCSIDAGSEHKPECSVWAEFSI